MKSWFSKKIFQKISIVLAILSVFCLVNLSQADYKFNEQSGLDASAGRSGFAIENSTNLVSMIGEVLRILLSFLGVLFFAYALYGGIVWMTADGNETKIKKANDIVMNALYGLIITLSVYVLSSFVIRAINDGELISDKVQTTSTNSEKK